MINTKKRWALYFQEAGTDGSKGVKRIHEFNGNVYAQDPRKAHFPSMPESAILADHPNFIETPAALAWIVSEPIANAKTFSSESRTRKATS